MAIADIKLDEGISDLKLPYHPDFGFENQVIFEDEEKPSWLKLSREILHFPQHKPLVKLITKNSKNRKYIEPVIEEDKSKSKIMASLDKLLKKQSLVESSILAFTANPSRHNELHAQFKKKYI